MALLDVDCIPESGLVADIVTNANLFHSRWGWYTMGGWLEKCQQLSMVELTDEGGALRGWTLSPR